MAGTWYDDRTKKLAQCALVFSRSSRSTTKHSQHLRVFPSLAVRLSHFGCKLLLHTL